MEAEVQNSVVLTITEFTEIDPLHEDKKIEEKVKRNLCAAIKYVFSCITVEPTSILLVIPTIIIALTSQNLALEKACIVNLNFTEDICRSLKLQEVESQNNYEREVQKLIASWAARKTLLTATIPSLLVLFIGSWSDRTGRKKIFIIVPVAGMAIVCLNGMLNLYFFHELPLQFLVMSEAFIESVTGGWCIAFTIMYSYISAVTSVESRTFRLGIVTFCLSVGFPIGMGLSGILLKKIGLYGSFGFGAAVCMINLLYTIFILKDPERTSEQKQQDGRGLCYFIRTFFDLKNIKATFQVVFKKGSNNRRMRVILMMCTVALLFGPLFGELSIIYISTRYRFNWDAFKFSIYQTYNFVTHTIGTIFSITVLSKLLKWHDSVLGMISTTSKILASFVYCFAVSATVFYIGPLVEILNGTALLAIRSAATKLVDKDELGKVNSIYCLVENLTPLVFVPLYTKVYTSTMEVLPGAVFLMGAAITFPTLLVFIWLFYEHRKEDRRSKQKKIETDLQRSST